MKFCVKLTFLNTVIVAITAMPLLAQKSGEDVGEYGDYFEGDMLLSKEQYKEIEDAKMPHDDKGENIPKNGLISISKRWPNKTVVYDIQEDDNINEDQIRRFEEALQDIADQSCIKFRKRESKDEYAVVLQRRQNGCFSEVGYHGRSTDESNKPNQTLNLGDKCFLKHGTIIHEMLHTLGFHHMQSTYDRDDYVTIVWENIQSGAEHNFARYTNTTVTEFGEPYDYGSVMHYSEKAFSKNGNETIIPKKEGVTLGQRKGLSKSDILKVNRMYECPTEAANMDKESITDLNWLDNVSIVNPFLDE